MQPLLRACFFRHEELPHPCNNAGVECVDVSLLRDYVARSRAQLHSVCEGLVSVSVREQSQSDVRGLMCGARTLVVDEATGAVVVRGVNKFFDYAELMSDTIHGDHGSYGSCDGIEWRAATESSSMSTHDPSPPPSLCCSSDSVHGSTIDNVVVQPWCLQRTRSYAAILWDRHFTLCPMWVQRKMAGFVVTLFTLDGHTLRVMSKHVWEGPHVEMARGVLCDTLSPAQQSAVAADLHRMQLSVSCECIAEAMQDYTHPVPESAVFRRTLIVFAVQTTHRVMECALPFEHVVGLTARWGLRCVPHARLPTPTSCAVTAESAEVTRGSYSRSINRTTSMNNHASTDEGSGGDANTKGSSVCTAPIVRHGSRAAAVQAIVDSAQQWHARYEPFAPWRCATLAEGFVLLLEVPVHTTQSHTDTAHMSRNDTIHDTESGVSYSLCRPVRMKVKTTQYVALRSLRVLLTSPSLSASRMPLLLYHRAVDAWARAVCDGSSSQARAWLQRCVAEDGVFAVHRRFVHDISDDRGDDGRETDADAEVGATERASRDHDSANRTCGDSCTDDAIRSCAADGGTVSLAATNSSGAGAGRHERRRWRGAGRKNATGWSLLRHLSQIEVSCFRTRLGECPLTVLILCGLPGSGKTLLATAMVKQLTRAHTGVEANIIHHVPRRETSQTNGATARPNPFDFVTYLSRDTMTADAMAANMPHAVTPAATADNTDATTASCAMSNVRVMSRHQERRLRRVVHHAMMTAIRQVAHYAAWRRAAGLLLLDGCHATREARQAWRRALPHIVRRCVVVHVDSGGVGAVAQRLRERQGRHEMLVNESMAQRALYAVARRFEAPRQVGQAWCEVVTAAQSRTEQRRPRHDDAKTHASSLPAAWRLLSVRTASWATTLPHACTANTPPNTAATSTRSPHSATASCAVWPSTPPAGTSSSAASVATTLHRRTLCHSDTVGGGVCVSFHRSDEPVDGVMWCDGPRYPAVTLAAAVVALLTHRIDSVGTRHDFLNEQDGSGDGDSWEEEEEEEEEEDGARALDRYTTPPRSSAKSLTRVITALRVDYLTRALSHLADSHGEVTGYAVASADESACFLPDSVAHTAAAAAAAVVVRLPVTCDALMQLVADALARVVFSHRESVPDAEASRTPVAALRSSALPTRALSSQPAAGPLLGSISRRVISMWEYLFARTCATSAACVTVEEEPAVRVELVQGQSRWLRGWLLGKRIKEDNKTAESGCGAPGDCCGAASAAAIHAALWGRFSPVRRSAALPLEQPAVRRSARKQATAGYADLDDATTHGAVSAGFSVAAHTSAAAHMTLWHRENGTCCDSATSSCAARWPAVGQRVRVQLTEILMDRLAVCFAATLVTADGVVRTQQWGSWALEGSTVPPRDTDDTTSTTELEVAGEAIPLHVSVGTAEGVAARYTGTMVSRFDAMERWNAALRAGRATGRAVRSQEKFYNFVRLRLGQPLWYEGTVMEM